MKNKKLFWLYLLSASIYTTQGLEGLPGLSLFFYLKEHLHLAPEKMMWISSIISIPWIIKPLWGFFIDNYLSKRLWIILSLIGSILISFYFGLSPYLTIPIIIIMSILGNLATAWRDISNDGLACIEGKENNCCDKFQNVQWTSITLAGIVTGLAGGYIADHFSYKFAYLCLIPIYLIILWIISKYKPQKQWESLCKTCSEKLSCPSETFNSISFKVLNKVIDCKNYKKVTIQHSEKSSLLGNILSYKELFTNKTFLLGCLFIFLYNFNPSFGTPLMYIERDTFKWSGTFMGILGAITSAVSIIGSFIYYKISKKINIKKVLYWSIFLGALTTLSYLYFTPISAITYGVIYSIIGMFIFLNVMTYMAQITIKGKESTSFALLCSINNLAATCGTIAGAYLFPKIGLNFLIIVSAGTSFLCLPIIKHLKIEEEK